MDLSLNANRFTGKKYVDNYARYRPTPPDDILVQSLNYLDAAKAEVVVDLGCGTGISTRIWRDYAMCVTGIDPSAEMLAIAKKNNEHDHIEFIRSMAHQTRLPDESVEIVTCSQSFHWMEPHSTLNEVNRILKPNGVLVIYDAKWPPSVNLMYERAYNELFDRVNKITGQLQDNLAYKWDKSRHYSNIVDSNLFRFVHQKYYHKSIPFQKENFIGLALSQGGLEALLKNGFSESEIGLNNFMSLVASYPSPAHGQLTYHYHAIFGKK